MNDVIGGPGITKETCKKCGKKWDNYRGGSYDWEYKDCIECRVKATVLIIPDKPKEPNVRNERFDQSVIEYMRGRVKTLEAKNDKLEKKLSLVEEALKDGTINGLRERLSLMSEGEGSNTEVYIIMAKACLSLVEGLHRRLEE